MRIAIHVGKDAALRRGSDAYGWRVVDVPATTMPPFVREFLIRNSATEPGKYGVPDADYAVLKIRSSWSCHLHDAYDAPEVAEAIDVMGYLQAEAARLEACEKEHEKEQAAERLAQEQREREEKEKRIALGVRVLAGEFGDGMFSDFRFSSRIQLLDGTAVLLEMDGDTDFGGLAVYEYAREAVARQRAREEEAEERRKREEAEADRVRRDRILGYLHGSASERYVHGVLAQEELDEILTDIAHKALADCRVYERIVNDAIEHSEECCNPDVEFKVYDEGDERVTVDAETWLRVKALREKLPAGAQSRIRLHRGFCRCAGCDHVVERLGLQVKIDLPGVGTFAREYAI